MDSSRILSTRPQNTWLFLLQNMQLFSYLINQTCDRGMEAWAVRSQDVCMLPLTWGWSLAHLHRCSHPDEEDRSQMQSPESVSVSSLSCQCTSTRGLPLHDPLKYVMPITGQLPVCPRPSLIPLPVDRCGNRSTWSLRWICGRVSGNPGLVTLSLLNRELWGVRDYAVPINQHPQHLLTSMEWAWGSTRWMNGGWMSDEWCPSRGPGVAGPELRLYNCLFPFAVLLHAVQVTSLSSEAAVSPWVLLWLSICQLRFSWLLAAIGSAVTVRPEHQVQHLTSQPEVLGSSDSSGTELLCGLRNDQALGLTSGPLVSGPDFSH